MHSAHTRRLRQGTTGIACSIGIMCMVAAAHAGTPSTTVGVGARPLGMGGAFVGLADDAHAIYWNPAGLPRLQRQEFTGSYMPNRLISGLNTGYGAATIPIGERQAVGADMFYESYSDNELSFTSFNLRASYGLSLFNWLSVGGNAKYVAPLSVKYNNNQVDDPRGFGFDVGTLLDFGNLLPALEGLRVGAVVRDVGGTSVKHDNDFSENIYPATYVVGASYKLNDSFTFAADLDDRARFGVEYSLLNLLSLRAGVQRTVQGYGTGMYYNGGAGIKWRGIKLDYAYETHPTLNPTHYMTLSFVYNPSFVTIRDARINQTPLFRALYRSYEQEPEFAQVTLKNTSQDPLRVNVGLRIPTLMAEGSSHAQDFTLPPQSTQTVSLGVTLDDSLLIRDISNYDNLVQPEVFVNYTQERETKQAQKKLSSVFVLGKNKLTWLNPTVAAAFVTPDHTPIVSFADRAASSFRSVRDTEFSTCPNYGTAMILFAAVSKYGVLYNPDQNTPFYKIASDTSQLGNIFDTVKFPIETLRSRLGDCDDVSVLFISLLESQSVPTALLDVFDPALGHIYMMFDTGLTPEQAMQSGLFLSEDEFVTWTDPGQEVPEAHAWIPVETTMFGQPFSEAVRVGLAEYREKKARNYIREWSIAQGRSQYQAGILDSASVAFPNVGDVQQYLAAEIERMKRRLELPPLEEPVTAEKLYMRGAELRQRGQYAQAIEAFSEAIRLRPDFADAYNGRGVARNHEGGRVRYMSDDPPRRREEAERLWRDAVADFREAIRLNPRESGYWVNLMISFQLLNDTQEAQQAREQALQIDEELRPVLEDIFRTGQ